MGRPLRVQFPGAIYHAMTRGNRRSHFLDERDYTRFLEGLDTTVDKFGFEIFSFVMPNHVHLVFRTPRPNLSKGMQYLLSGYANWFNTRHRRPGHLFQGRFKGELIEDEGYFCNVSRYVHLNPLWCKRPLADGPEEWRWSSYPGYRWKSRRVDWVAYDSVYRAWQGERGGGGGGGGGGKHPETAYRRFVDARIDRPPPNPLAAATDGWLLGSQESADRIRRLMKSPKYRDEVPAARRLSGVSLADVLEQTADHFGVDVASFAQKHSKQLSRDTAAWLARRLTVATLRDLPFGLGHPDSVRGLLGRAEAAMSKSARFRREVDELRAAIRDGSRRSSASHAKKHVKRV